MFDQSSVYHPAMSQSWRTSVRRLPAVRARSSQRPSRVRAIARTATCVLKALVLGSFALAVTTTSVGCTAVAPYERGKLAHPTMSAGALGTMGEDHLHAISEGATGGSGGTGSGCGCN